ncbi:globin [Planococcus salinarum]|uniref:Globin n=1 Tax=Planococcus salinarum TaxID=622695 RepID=A0ABX3CZJ9_9BACL|nr:globin [Planococcus salinarum]OHX50911.1 globin [Planococcus salinarum]TAA73163.1 globin [Planococcus salinarum]
MPGKPIIPYEEIGAERLSLLVDAFYARVAMHPKLKPIFPDDLSETARKQKQFMTQYLGGPNIYSEEHGHPRLKARHNPFPITPERAQAWLECMSEAMDEIGLSGKFRETFYQRLVMTAHHMVNAPDSEEEML